MNELHLGLWRVVWCLWSEICGRQAQPNSE